jgi:hypothetical protein
LKAPGVEVDFELQVRQIAATTAEATEELKEAAPKALPAVQPKDIVLPPETADQRRTRYQQLAVLDPRAAVLLSYADMESAIRQRFREIYPQERPGAGFGRVVEVLHRDRVVDDDVAGAMRQMSKIRNQVAHELAEVDVGTANYFVESAGNVLGYLLLSDFFGNLEQQN